MNTRAWWLDASALPERELWALVRPAGGGGVEVLDCDGRAHTFPDLVAAEHWLREDEYEPLEALIKVGRVASTVVPPRQVRYTSGFG